MEDLVRRLKALDAYPKVNEDFFTRTFSGGVITVLASLAMGLLFLSELRASGAPPAPPAPRVHPCVSEAGRGNHAGWGRDGGGLYPPRLLASGVETVPNMRAALDPCLVSVGRAFGLRFSFGETSVAPSVRGWRVGAGWSGSRRVGCWYIAGGCVEVWMDRWTRTA